MLDSKFFLFRRFICFGTFFLVSSASQGMVVDTLIIDSSYIYVEVDTTEFNAKDSMNSAASDATVIKERSRYKFSVCGDFLYNLISLTNFNAGYALLQNALPKSPVSTALRQVSLQGGAELYRLGKMRRWRKNVFAFRNGVGGFLNSLKFPVANVGNAQSLYRDSIIDARIDGDDVMLSYYNSFDQGVGELDTVYEPWQRKVLQWQLLGISGSYGIHYQRLNSPWILNLDASLSALLLLRGDGQEPIGLISEKLGYKDVFSNNLNKRWFTNYSVKLSVERILSGITDGPFKDASIGLRFITSSPVQLHFQEISLRSYQLGLGVFFTIAL